MAVPATTNDRAPGDGFLVLWIGGIAIAERDAQVELRREGVRVEAAAIEELIERANERAPDLIVLGGEAGAAPDEHVAQLAATTPASAIPIVALGDAPAGSPRPKARFGLVACIDRRADGPTMAKNVSTLVHLLASRTPVWRVESKSGDYTLAARKFARDGRCGILSGDGAGSIAIEAGGAIAQGPQPLKGEQVQFFERPPGRLLVVSSTQRLDETTTSLEGVRALVIDDDIERREKIAQRLEKAAVQTRATGAVAQAVHASRALDPTIVICAAPVLSSSALGPLWNEPRLGNASILILDGAALADAAEGPWMGVATALCRPELSLRRRLRGKEAIADRLETLGAARWLKLLGRCEHSVTLRVFGSAGRARVDMEGGRIQGAAVRPLDPSLPAIEGRAAVDALMTMTFGRVLAGPPAALAELDGGLANRRPSTIGRIETTPTSGVRRKQAEVAQEVVVKAAVVPPPRKLRTDQEVVRLTKPTEPEIPAVEERKPLWPPVAEAAPIAMAPEPVRMPSPVPEPLITPSVLPPPPVAPSSVKRKSNNAVWFGATLVLVLGVGAWVAWRHFAGGPATNASEGRIDEGEATTVPPEPTVEPEVVEPEEPEPAVEVQQPSVEPPTEVAAAEPPSEPIVAAPETAANIDTLLENARRASVAHQDSEAAAIAREVLAASPHNGQAAYRLALSLQRLGQSDEALEWAERAAGWDPASPHALALAGDIHRRFGRFQRAARVYAMALQREPGYGPAERGLAELAERGVTPSGP